MVQFHAILTGSPREIVYVYARPEAPNSATQLGPGGAKLRGAVLGVHQQGKPGVCSLVAICELCVCMHKNKIGCIVKVLDSLSLDPFLILYARRSQMASPLFRFVLAHLSILALVLAQTPTSSASTLPSLNKTKHQCAAPLQ